MDGDPRLQNPLAYVVLLYPEFQEIDRALRDTFVKLITEVPVIYTSFVNLAIRLSMRGFTNYPISRVLDAMSVELDLIQGGQGGDPFALRADYIPLLMRLALVEYPGLDDFFAKEGS